jgi:uncharacterized protein (DUF2147 family)
MKKIATLILLCSTFLFMPFIFAANASMQTSPVGYWKTIDDVTGKPKAIMQIWHTGDNALYGRVLKIFPSPGHDQNELCTECSGERHNKRIVGMVILENLRQSSDSPTVWTGGTILDPKNGKVYQCTMQVINNGANLNVRGYIGLSLFGRTQTWNRVRGAE